MDISFYKDLRHPQVQDIKGVPLLVIKEGEQVIGIAFEEIVGNKKIVTFSNAMEPDFESILKRYHIHGKSLQVKHI